MLLRIFFCLAIFIDTISATISFIDKLSVEFDWFPDSIDSDTFLDTNEWIRPDEIPSESVDNCSYIDRLLKTNYSNGFLEVAASPNLVYNKYGVILGRSVRIIFKVDYQNDDIISLYVDTSGGEGTSRKLIEKKLVPENSREEHIDLNVLYDPTQPYLAEYTRKSGQVMVSIKYYRYRPGWMWCMRDVLGSRPLNKILLPGTHNSGSYTAPSWWQNKFYITTIYVDYVFTQEETVYSQLMQGARILDLRLGKYNKSDIFYVNHNTFKVHPLKKILDQILEFLIDSPNEIVILDFHRFPEGFITRLDYDQLADFVFSKLGDLIFRPGPEFRWDITLNDIWKTKARIFIAFSDYPTAIRKHLFPEVDQIWGDKDNLKDLVEFMDKTLPINCNQPSNLFSCAMVEITPRGWSVLKNKYGGLRHLSSITNSIVTNRFAVGKWGIATQAASVDFISSTGIVTASILQNYARATNKNHPCY